jgi:hypothetical protein
VELVDDVEHIGLDKHLNKQSSNNKMDDLDQEKQIFIIKLQKMSKILDQTRITK